jgi:ubiquinone/menaquinone biosynthesis C-methylase UbiE
MGHCQSEQERLILQASILRPWTSDFFRDAGLSTGMRVLDVGCGLGDVSFLAAELVGPAGSVIGIDREQVAVERAGHRAKQVGLTGRVRFVHAAMDDFASQEVFDAVVGRYILVHLADPAATLRHLANLVRPGGLLVFHELAIDPFSWGSFPEAPLWNWAYGLFAAAVSTAGILPDFGKRLVRTFLDAGLPRPTDKATVPVGGGSGSYLYRWLAESLRSVLPLIEQAGLATADEVGIDSLAARMEAESVTLGSQAFAGTQFGAWVAMPGAPLNCAD